MRGLEEKQGGMGKTQKLSDLHIEDVLLVIPCHSTPPTSPPNYSRCTHALGCGLSLSRSLRHSLIGRRNNAETAKTNSR
jgi:hypothetical protein